MVLPRSNNDSGEPTEVTFDHHDPGIAADPHPTYAALRAGCPLSRSRAWGGFWIAARRDEVVAAAHHEELRTAVEQPDGTIQGISIPSLGQTGRLLPLETDAPRSLELRRTLASHLSARRVTAEVAGWRRLAARCVDDIIEAGVADLVAALTSRLPALVTFAQLGLDEERWPEVVATIHRALLSAAHDPEAAREAALEVCAGIVDSIEGQRGGGRRPGLIGDLLATRIGGVPVPADEIVSIVYLLLLGIDPTSTLTATALWHLAGPPGLRAPLAADPAQLPRAAEEYLRWVSPVQSTARTATADIDLGGRNLRPGERVLLSWASANRDERHFAAADTVDVDRREVHHVAFGAGAHFCLGAAMVRAQFCVMVAEVLRRLPDYELDGAATWFPDLSSVYGVRSLPVRFSPGHRLAP